LDILGIMLNVPNSVKTVKEILSYTDFYTESSQLICRSIFKISEKGIADVKLVYQDIVDSGLVDKIGGIYDINKLSLDTTSDSNIKQYCLIVKEKSVQRRLIDFGSHILTSVLGNEDDVFDTLLESEIKLKGLNFEM